MSVFPQLSGKEAVRIFARLGYQVVRQRGSHVRLSPPPGTPRKPLSIPDHAVLGKGLLRKLLRDANTSLEELRTFL